MAEPRSPTADVPPLPSAMMRIYYLFPIVLYVPDALFNFYVYSDGSGLDTNTFTLTSLPGYLLWGFLATGIVGMAWLCSVLAPWHWLRGNRFQSVMCWFGVLVATGITTWNSLAYRSQKFVSFHTDGWVNLGSSFSLTMIIVSVSPPFWGLFWAIVQPAVGKKSAAEAAEDHEAKLLRLQQEAEYKRLRAEANAGIRAAQLKGLAATMKAARDQVRPSDVTEDAEESPVVAAMIASPLAPVATDRTATLMRTLLAQPAETIS